MRYLLVAASFALCAQAQAQSMYRCGNVYQDRPCAAGMKSRVVGSTGVASAPSTPSAGVDPECAQRGRDSHKIVWAREGGASEERLLSEARSAHERRLVQDVYRRPGGASTVQAAVQADCVAEKQRDEQEAAIAIAAALKARREAGDAPPPAQPAAPVQASTGQPPRADDEAGRRSRACAAYDAEMDRLRSAERAGGSAARMDSLNERRRTLRGEMSRAGC